MAYTRLTTKQGEFSVDWDVITTIVKSYVRAAAQNKFSKIANDASKDNSGPEVTFLEVDWDKVRDEVLTESWKILLMLAQQSFTSMDSVAHQVKDYQARTKREIESFQSAMSKASDTSKGEMEKYVASYGRIITGLQIIRDLSAAFVIGAASFGGGAAASAGILRTGLLATGAATKIVGKWEDTYNQGSVAIEATQNIVLTVVPVVSQVKLVGETGKVVISVGAEIAKSLVEGKAVWESLLNGAVQIPVPAVGAAAEKAFLKVAIPPAQTPVSAGVGKAAGELFKKASKIGIGAAKTGLANAHEVITNLIMQRPHDSDEPITFWDDVLVKLAIVDMAQGVGWSAW